jgi:hypothetical protein
MSWGPGLITIPRRTIIGRFWPWIHRLLIKQEVGQQGNGMSKI